MTRHLLPALAAAILVAACIGGSSVAGKYAYINWGQSQKQCNNDVCTYGQNQEEFEAAVRCNEKTRLSWDLEDWIHGSFTVTVLDPTDAQKERRQISANGKSSLNLTGAKGEWHLLGSTQNANGQLQVRLTCL